MAPPKPIDQAAEHGKRSPHGAPSHSLFACVMVFHSIYSLLISLYPKTGPELALNFPQIGPRLAHVVRDGYIGLCLEAPWHA